MKKLKNTLGGFKSLYLFTLIIGILLGIYLLTDITKYFPSELSMLSKSSSTFPISITNASGVHPTGKAYFRSDAALFEGLTMEVTNANGALSVEARKGSERCYRVDGFTGCLSLQTTTADQPGQSFLSERISPNVSNKLTSLEAAEGSINFDTIKDAIEWIDNERNRAFNFIYDDRGLAAGWYRLNLPQGPGSMIRAQVWQLYIDGEKPEMLPGSDRKNMSFARRAVEISAVSPPPPQIATDSTTELPISKKIKPDPLLLEKLGQEYCLQRENEEFGEQSEPNSEKKGVLVPFLMNKNEQIVSTLGASYLEPTLERWIEEKDKINSSNRRPVKDPKKIHLSFDKEAYYLPNDIADWIESKKHFVVTGKWFKYKDVDYLYLSAGLDPSAFLFDERETDDVFFKTEVVYMFVNDRYGEIIRGEKIDILRIENDLLMIGVGNYGYEGANGKVIAFDGNKKYELCDWGFGM